MSYASTLAALESRLRDRWTETAVFAAGESINKPEPPAPFVVFDVETDLARIVTFGDGGYHRTSGRVELTIYAPSAGAGRGLVMEIAERLAALFPTGADVEGARLGAPGFGRVLVADGDTGWLTADVTVPFHLDLRYEAA